MLNLSTTLSCPSCSKYSFSYLQKLSLLVKQGIQVKTVTCKRCNEDFCVTPMSMLIIALAAPLSILISLFFKFDNTGNILWALFLIFIFWPLVVKVREASLTPFDLPESRLVGYIIYLVFPILIIAVTFLLAIKISS